jgi:hypothetical protein
MGANPGALYAAWLELAVAGVDLLVCTRNLLLNGEHVLAEPKELRYRLLHVAARMVCTVYRPPRLRPRRQPWPWAGEVAAVRARLGALPRPIG